MISEVDAAVAEASDANTAQVRLAEIAFQRADLRAVVACNPSAYPGLLDWLASLGDAVVDAALVRRSGGQAELISQGTTLPSADKDNGTTPILLSSDDIHSPIPARASVMSIAATSPRFAVMTAAIAAVIVVGGAALAPSAPALAAVGYLVYLVALLAPRTTVRRKTVSAAMVGIFCVLPAVLDAIDPSRFISVTGWLVFVGYGALVLSWLLVRERDPATYLIAPLALVAAFGWYAALVALVTLTGLPGDSVLVRLATAGGTSAIVVGGCWLARAASLRRRSHLEGLSTVDAGSLALLDARILNIDDRVGQR